MSAWRLLIVEGSAHVVDLSLEIIEIPNFGRFSSEAVQNQEKGVEFELFNKKCLVTDSCMSDIMHNVN